MSADSRVKHQKLVRRLEHDLGGNTQRLYIKKKTVSNLFRYDGRNKLSGRIVDLRQFNKPLFLDRKNQTLDVQGLATFEQIVDFVLPQGFLPLVTPELKHITIGGACVGIGIETNSFRYGFVHNSLLEAEVLLPDGKIVVCSPANEHRDLLKGLANSYGTLGYILRAKIQLRPVSPYVQLNTKQFSRSQKMLDAIKQATAKGENDYIESLVYSSHEMYLTIGTETDTADNLMSIYKDTMFFKTISRPGQFTLPIKEYIFRYDPEWFWNLDESKTLQWFRRLAPPSVRNSGFYSRWGTLITKLPFIKSNDDSLEHLIQDWEVPWSEAPQLLEFILDNVDLNGKPLMVAPLAVPETASGYPLPKGQQYLNIGSYSFVRRQPNRPAYYHTKLIDEFCFSHGGIKMLYSSTFLPQSKFEHIYGGASYAKLKQKYDPLKLLPTLFEKAVKSQ